MTTEKKKRGFAVMDPQRVCEIAAMGGQQSHLQGRAHQFTSAEARAASAKRHDKKAAKA